MHIGTIADDLTGATDIAGFLANGGLDVVQFMGTPDEPPPGADAAVVSLKSRSIPAADAVGLSLAAQRYLAAAGCRQFYFKYCSTFDSTAKGNIGPVTDALMDRTGTDLAVVCPSLPANKRTVRDGILLVDNVPLAETGMRHHPINPMTESDLVKLMEMQSKGKAGLVRLDTVRKGPRAVEDDLARIRAEGCRYAVVDAIDDADLDRIAEAVRDMPLLTGGSGLGQSRAKEIRKRLGRPAGPAKRVEIPRGRAAALSGSCSEMTNRQVAFYKDKAKTAKIDVRRCIGEPDAYAGELADWADGNAGGEWAPLLYATAEKGELSDIQKKFGDAASAAVEDVFARLASLLAKRGFDRFIVAGGETSGAVSGALPAKAFRLGAEIAPGVPWIRGVGDPLCLALKSGNFGDETFFVRAQELMA